MKYDTKQIERARLARGWSRRDLAAAAEVAASTVSAVEDGISQSPATVKALAQALKLKLADLVVDDDAGVTA